MDAVRVLPGSAVPAPRSAEAGDGLYRRDGRMYASRAGTLAGPAAGPRGEQVFRVVPFRARASHPLLPAIGQTVVGTVCRITARFASVDLSVVEGASPADRPVYLEEPFRGTLRIQDIWPADDKDAPTQHIHLALRPGDLVRARIIGVGDASAGFLLSTAVHDALGVVFARSVATGEPLVAVSWNEMVCPATGTKEPRKPARPENKQL